jgi:hypothetical protein
VSFKADEVSSPCWCPLAKRMVELKGKIVGTRQADILLVVECGASDCRVRRTIGCLVGKEIESRWR